MKKILLGAAAVAIALAFGAAHQQAAAKTYVFALVPKNTNNPFFDQARDGCKKAEAESKGAFQCLYIGPDEHGGGEEEVQVVADLIAKKVDGIATSPANAAAMGKELEEARKAGIPVLTFDADLLDKDKGLRLAFVGTHNYEIGVNLAKLAMKVKPKGGTVCIQSGGAAAANHNERIWGIRDTLAGMSSPSSEAPGTRLTGQNGWTETDGCPLYTNDDFTVALQQEQDILEKYPHLDAFIPTGGFSEFLEQAYKTTMAKYKDKIASGAIAIPVADTLAMQIDELKLGLATGNVGQRPFEMGYKAMWFLNDIKNGKPAPHDPTYTGLDVVTPENVNSFGK